MHELRQEPPEEHLPLPILSFQNFYGSICLYLAQFSGIRRKFSWGDSFSDVWWSFLYRVRCLWRHSHVSKPTFWRSLL